ncbi:MAG: branched-chain amino acid ABC transporter permease [Spirochaetales bacterium]|jgi:branched-chain amino acid transport system permease protein|nr:branched-chain amino acid ABC transporter permease [Spirochaetales bacterium]
MKKFLKYAALVLPLICVPLLAGNIYYLRLCNLAMIYGIFALGLNILTGYTGITSFGHAGFFALGAYTSAILAVKAGLPVLVCIPLAGLITAAAAYLVGLPVRRISGIYLAMVTLGFAEFIRILAINLEWLTGGPLGISRIPPLAVPAAPPGIFNPEQGRFFFLYITTVLLVAFFVRLIRSRFGRCLLAIRDSEDAAASIGIACAANKMAAFFFSGLYSGLAGALYAHFDRFISPDTFQFDMSVLVLCMVVAGGMGSVFGSLLGAGILVILLEVFQPLGDYRLIAYGSLLMIMITWFPGGLAGGFESLRKKILPGQTRNTETTGGSPLV